MSAHVPAAPLSSPALREVAHQRASSEFPGRRVARGRDDVDERAELWRRNAHLVADLVGKAAARLVAILGRREQRAEEQHETVRIMMLAHAPAERVLRDRG